jgi:hypothetical protein
MLKSQLLDAHFELETFENLKNDIQVITNKSSLNFKSKLTSDL